MYKYGKLIFEWDELKHRLNIDKHGVSFYEAISCFNDKDGFRLKDESHSLNEDRFLWVGKSKNKRVLTIYITYRENAIRIIGAAEWRKYRRKYYERVRFQKF